MTILVAAVRMYTLTSQISDVEYMIMGLEYQREKYTSQIQDLYSQEDYDDKAMEKLKLADDIIEQKLEKYQTLYEEYDTEYDSVKKLLENNIKDDFKFYSGSGS